MCADCADRPAIGKIAFSPSICGVSTNRWGTAAAAGCE
jgi:hypothetical protein